MRKESQRWTLDVGKRYCLCGTPAAFMTNAGSKRCRVAKHRAPDGSACLYYEGQAALERTNRALAATGQPTEYIPSARKLIKGVEADLVIIDEKL